MTFIHDEPFRSLRNLDRVAGQLLSGSRVPLSVPMDVWREERAYHVELDLPGVDPGAIDVQVERNGLTVTAQRRASFEVADEDRQVVVAERPHGHFTRQLVLGESLDADGVQAEYTDGVLHLTIPLAQASRPRKIDVTQPGGTGATGSASTPDEGPSGDASAADPSI
jgi:HSP20 family protein